MARKTINSKPSRFGSLQELLAIYEYCEQNGIGDLQRRPGRARSAAAGQIQYLSSLFHASMPNDIAPVGLQRSRRARRDADEPDGPGAVGRRLPLGGVGSRAWLAKKKNFADALNDQIANEFARRRCSTSASPSTTTPRRCRGWLRFFYRQALEERSHAMMMIQYLLDVDEQVRIPDIAGVETKFADDVAPVRAALEQEKRVGEEIYSLFELAREAKDYRAEQFMQWFVKEQVEEVSLMTDLLNVVERSEDNLLAGRGLHRPRVARRGRRGRRPARGRRLVLVLVRGSVAPGLLLLLLALGVLACALTLRRRIGVASLIVL